MLTELGEKIFRMKYAISDKEDWLQACVRVAEHVSSAEKEEDRATYMAKFVQLISEKFFIPGGRILSNSGTGIKNLMNCFVLPLEDSREGIYQTLKNSAEIFAWGGGIGYDFSELREEGARISSTGGTSSGPISFMELFDLTGEVIKQSSRRGAQMGMMHVDHPDILKFINRKSKLSRRNQTYVDELKRKVNYDVAGKKIAALGYAQSESDKLVDEVESILLDNQLNHFNISVILNDSFMERVERDELWELVSPDTGEVIEVVPAREIFEALAKSAWESGDPGVFFFERAEDDNLTPYVGSISATNPCGEVPLLPYESCCLGSLNLRKFYNEETKEKIDWELLEYAVRLSIRFLDNIQTVSEAPIEEITTMSRGLRRLGLGVMGWADLLAMLELPYDSEEAFRLAEKLSWFITFFAWSESMRLAEEKGTFEFFDKDKINPHMLQKILNSPYAIQEGGPQISQHEWAELRNNSVTSIAPTGSIALVAGVNSSIEPFYSLAYKRHITEGIGNVAKDSVTVYNPILNDKLLELHLTEDQTWEVEKALDKFGTIQHLSFLPREFRNIFKTAHEIDWKDHIKMQSAWQSYTTNAVSKTINMPKNSTIQDVQDAFMEMWKAGLKGGTIYRDGSKSFQILN